MPKGVRRLGSTKKLLVVGWRNLYQDESMCGGARSPISTRRIQLVGQGSEEQSGAAEERSSGATAMSYLNGTALAARIPRCSAPRAMGDGRVCLGADTVFNREVLGEAASFSRGSRRFRSRIDEDRGRTRTSRRFSRKRRQGGFRSVTGGKGTSRFNTSDCFLG